MNCPALKGRAIETNQKRALARRNMYKFSYYTEKDQEKVIAFIKENPFALITGIGENHPVATQIPLAIKIKDDKIFLEGHMMRKTDHHLAFEKNNNVLVLFTGPH